MSSLLALAFSSLVVVAPARPLADLPVPLGRLTDVLAGPIEGGVHNSETVIEYQPEGCEHTISLNLTRLIAGAAFSLQQLQDWMGRTDGLERSLFVKAGRLGTVAERVVRAVHVDQKACKASKVADGFKLELQSSPKLCQAPPGRTLGEHWFLADGQPSAVVQIAAPAPESKGQCLPRVSVIFFDDRQAARLRYHADFGGRLSATLVADRCQDIDFSLDQEAQVFHALRRGCKR